MINQYMVKQCNAIRRELGKDELPLNTTGEVGDQNVLWDFDYVHARFGMNLSCVVDGEPEQYVAWADPRTRKVGIYQPISSGSGKFDLSEFVAHRFNIVNDKGEVVLGWGI